MSAGPLVTIIMPYYNLDGYTGGDMEELMQDSVGSVLSQTYQNWELIIVDHHSDEPTSLAKLTELSRHKQVKVVQSDRSYFLPAARNFGIKATSGELICCLDADDKYHPDFVAECVSVFAKDDHKRVGFITSFFHAFDQADAGIRLQKSNLELLFKNIPHVASMFRRDAWEKVGGYEENKERLPGYQDWDFWLSIVEAGYDWQVIEKELFYYRIREGSMLTGSRKRDDEMYEYILSKHAKLLAQYSTEELLHQARKIIINYDTSIKLLQKELSKGRSPQGRAFLSKTKKLISNIIGF